MTRAVALVAGGAFVALAGAPLSGATIAGAALILAGGCRAVRLRGGFQ